MDLMERYISGNLDDNYSICWDERPLMAKAANLNFLFDANFRRNTEKVERLFPGRRLNYRMLPTSCGTEKLITYTS